MSLLPARIKKIQLKMKALDCSQNFYHYKSKGIFPDSQGQLAPQSMVGSGLILNIFCDLIIVLLTCENEEDSIKNEGARVATR